MASISDLLEQIEGELNVVGAYGDDDDVKALAEELADGVTPERDAEIAELLPVPYTIKVPARAQLDGDMLRCPRVAYVDASLVPGEDWVTSSARGRRLRREKTGAYMAFNVELDIPNVVKIVKVAVLWRPSKD